MSNMNEKRPEKEKGFCPGCECRMEVDEKHQCVHCGMETIPYELKPTKLNNWQKIAENLEKRLIMRMDEIEELQKQLWKKSGEVRIELIGITVPGDMYEKDFENLKSQIIEHKGKNQRIFMIRNHNIDHAIIDSNFKKAAPLKMATKRYVIVYREKHSSLKSPSTEKSITFGSDKEHVEQEFEKMVESGLYDSVSLTELLENYGVLNDGTEFRN